MSRHASPQLIGALTTAIATITPAAISEAAVRLVKKRLPSAVAAEDHVRRDRRAHHVPIDEVKRRPVPLRYNRGGRRRLRVTDDDLPDRGHRKQRALAVGVDRTQLGLEYRKVERDRRRLGVQ